MQGFEEVTVRVGKPGSRRSKRFVGRGLTRWVHRTGGDHLEVFTVYRTVKGQYAVHLERSQDWRTWADPATWMDPGGWQSLVTGWCRSFTSRMASGQGWQQGWWWDLPGGGAESRLDVYQSFEDLEENVPAELADLVREAESEPRLEQLDI